MQLTAQLDAAPLLVDTFTETFEDAIESVIEALPTILLVLAILGVGYFVAKRLEAPVRRLIGLLDASDRLDDTSLESSIDEDGTVVSGLVLVVQFYVFLFAVLIAAEVADIAVVSEWVELLVRYVPELVGGVAIILLGILVGDAAAERTRAAEVTKESEYGGWIVAVVKAVIYGVAVIIGLEMIGFDLQIIYLIVDGIASAIGLGIAAAIALAIGLAVGFYAKDYVEQQDDEE